MQAVGRQGGRDADGAVVAACLALVLASCLGGSSFLEGLDLRAYDLRFFARGPVTPSGRVVVAAIDERSLHALGRWPWPRTVVGQLIDRLSAAGAEVVALDVGFLEPDQDPAADRALAASLRGSAAPVVLGYPFLMGEADVVRAGLTPEEVAGNLGRLSRSQYAVVAQVDDGPRGPALVAAAPEAPVAVLAAATPWAGFFTSQTDQDGTVRRSPLVIECRGTPSMALPVQAAWHYLDRPAAVLRTSVHGMEGIDLGDRSIATDELGRLLVNYCGPPGTFTTHSVSDVLGGRLPEGALRGKVVLVGVTAVGARDYCNTPYSAYHPGVEVLATVVDNLLEGRLLQKPQWWRLLDLALVVGLGVAAFALVRRLRAVAALVAVAALAMGYAYACQRCFVGLGLWLDVVHPLLALCLTYGALTVSAYVREERQRRDVQDAFGRYVSPAVIGTILADPGKLRLGGEERVITVLFSDLAGFTSCSETNSPSAMVALLSEYFEEMTAEVYGEGGLLKEYVGDELMALFGAPLEQPDHAARACRAALAMRDRLARLRLQCERTGRPPLRARTGVNTGRMLVGNLGSKYRFSYGALGDNVNLGSRLEGLNKQYGTSIIIGEDTAAAVRGAFHVRELDLVRVVGKTKPVTIFELLAHGGTALPEADGRAFEAYAAGLAAYRGREFEAAARSFEGALALRPDDGPSKVMLERCRRLALALPDGEWAAVFEATSK